MTEAHDRIRHTIPLCSTGAKDGGGVKRRSQDRAGGHCAGRRTTGPVGDRDAGTPRTVPTATPGVPVRAGRISAHFDRRE
jgi:hypothetical protein